MTTSTTSNIPPLAPGLPFVGSILALAQDAQDFFYTQYRQLGNAFRVRALGREFKVLAGPEINIAMATQPDAFTAWDIWEPVVRDFGGRRTLTMVDGPEHARMRRLLRQSFSREALVTHIPMVTDVVVESLRRYTVGARIPGVYFMQRMTADVLGLLSNGRVPGDQFDDIVLWWNTMMEVFISRSKPVSKISQPAYRQARARVKEFATTVFTDRQANRPVAAEDNFLDNLADTSQQDPEFLNHDEALFLTLVAYFAGLDTVANVSSFMLYELLKHPDILARVRAEADQAFAQGTPAADSLRAMPTLHATALETLRLYPIAGVLPRITARDFEFAGYVIPKGEHFMVANAAPHFAPQFYADPYRFDITRYSEPRLEHKKRGVFAPFGSGPHTCLGAGLAEVQIMLVIATLLHHAELALDPANYRLKKAYLPSMTPKGFGFSITAWRS
ncbi:cytochrome P450 [Candidatus Amarolinea aalborgensis]|uniref:cytochrome P450 n=1 Tax=Candidatus Amarolinea aalborgensis TaxID=2249329 RepID=UPI003BF9EF5B